MPRPTLFSDAARAVTLHVVAGRRVILSGAAGSGRSTVLRDASRTLEARGLTVLRADARLGGPAVSGQVLEQLDLLRRGADRISAGALLTARDALYSDPNIVVAIDDFDQADPYSARFFDAMEGRARTIRVVPSGFDVRPVWPEVTVEIEPLDFDGVRTLVNAQLDGPASLPLIARVLSRSGGNPELAAAVIGSALVEGRIEQRDGLWQLAAPILLNHHLEAYAYRFLEGLTEDERVLLHRLAVRGSETVQGLGLAADDPALRRLLRRRLIRTVAAGHAAVPELSVWPPLVADYLRRETPAVLLPDELASAEWISSDAEIVDDPAVTARIFQYDSDERAPALLAEWDVERTPVRAIAYLQRAVRARFERPSIRRVLRETEVERAPSAEVFQFELLRAQWTAYDEGDLNGALAALDLYAQRPGAPLAGIRAMKVLLRTFLDRLPADFREILGDPAEDETGLSSVALTILELFSGRISKAREYAPNMSAAQAIFDATILPLLDTFDGNAVAAHTRTSSARVAALVARDRFAYVGAAYADAVASMTAGDVPHVESSLQASLSTGKATMVLRPFFGATLNIAAITSALAHGPEAMTRALVDDAETYVARPGPLFGMGTDVPTIIASAGRDPEQFDLEMADAIRRRRELGYIAAAASVSVLAGAVYAGPLIADEVSRVAARADMPVYTRSFDAIVALAAGDFDAVADIARRPDRGDSSLVAQIVGSARRLAVRTGRTAVANALQETGDDLDARSSGSFAPLYIYADPAKTADLTAREIEVAALAAHMKNSEIASHLRVSIRTVENHISNSLRKTGATSREELTTAVEQ